MDITQLIEQWRKVVKQRRDLDALSRQLKDGPEAELKAQILMYLDMEGVNGTKTTSGTITRTRKSHMEISDLETFLKFQMQQFALQYREGKPLADAMVLQRTPLKSALQELIASKSEDSLEDDDTFNRVAESIGIRRVSEPDLSFKSA